MRDWWASAISSLESHSRWNQLKLLGGSNLVRASVLMPAFGYMLLLNDNVHQYLTIKYDGFLLTYLPNVWRIWLLFYGSFALAVATILYSYFCPPEVKRYSSPFEMADGETQHQLNLGQFKTVQALLKNLISQRSAWETDLLPLQLHLDRAQMSYSDPKSALGNLLIHQWSVRNMQKPLLRISIYLLFAAGLALVGIPAIVTFVQVTTAGVKHLLT